MQVLLNERPSVDRPAWTSEQETGMFDAYKHKHSIVNGRFMLQKDYYKHRKINAR